MHKDKQKIAELESQIQKLERDILRIHKEYGCELMDPYGTIWEHAARVGEQNKELIQKLKEYKHAN